MPSPPATPRSHAGRSRVAAAGACRAPTPRKPTAAERRVVDELLLAMPLGDIAAVLQRLAPQAVCLSDGGPHRGAARRPIVGAENVARFCIKVTRKAAKLSRPEPATINGGSGVIVYVRDEVDCVLAFGVDADGERVARIWVVRAPEKLDHVLAPVRCADRVRKTEVDLSGFAPTA